MTHESLFDYIFANIEISSDAKVLDVGCGSAATLIAIKERFGLSDELIGVDKRPNNFESKEVCEKNGVKLLEMDAAEHLAFDDEIFDFIFHKDMLECVKDIDAHILELHRVLKKGGTIICVHRDWESIAFNGGDKKLINKVIYEYANFLQSNWMDACDGWMGRRIFGRFNKTGLFDGEAGLYNQVETEFADGKWGYSYMKRMEDFISKNGFLSKAEYDSLLADLEATYKAGEYICANPFYVYIGKKL